jgi:hypothetical protein
MRISKRKSSRLWKGFWNTAVALSTWRPRPIFCGELKPIMTRMLAPFNLSPKVHLLSHYDDDIHLRLHLVDVDFCISPSNPHIQNSISFEIVPPMACRTFYPSCVSFSFLRFLSKKNLPCITSLDQSCRDPISKYPLPTPSFKSIS